DFVDILHALDHLAPYGVLPVEEGRIVKADEELAVGAVRVLCTRHGAHSAHVRLGVELGGKVGIVRAAGAGAFGAAGLRHEAVDDAVEDNAVVEALARQRLDALDVLGRQVRAQGDDHIALGRVHDECVLWVFDGGHVFQTPLQGSSRRSAVDSGSTDDGNGAIVGGAMELCVMALLRLRFRWHAQAGDRTPPRRPKRFAREPSARSPHLTSSRHFLSASTYTFNILSGWGGGSPRAILSTFSMPSMTSPHRVYCPVS